MWITIACTHSLFREKNSHTLLGSVIGSVVFLSRTVNDGAIPWLAGLAPIRRPCMAAIHEDLRQVLL